MNKLKYDLFLSYSRLDAQVAQLLAACLSDNGVRVWFNQWELVPGQDWGDLPRQAMEQSGAIGICIGSNSINWWNEQELDIALTIHHLSLIPILLPRASSTDIP